MEKETISAGRKAYAWLMKGLMWRSVAMTCGIALFLIV